MAEDVNPSQDGPGAGALPHSSNVRGGVTVVIVSLLLLLGAFAVSSNAIMFHIGTWPLSSTMVPRLLAILVAATGVAVALNLVPVRAPQEFYGGVVLILVAIMALVSSAELPGQRGFAFGPGTAPRMFALLLAGLGVAIALVGVFTDGPPIEKYKIKGPSLVVLAIFLFAALIRPFGLVIATYLAFLISIMGSKEMRWIESFIAAAVMTLFCVILFVYLLSLPFQLWPLPNAHVILFTQFEDIITQLWIILGKLLTFGR